MNAPQMPADFYPNETQEERNVRWLTLEAEAQEMQRRDLMKCEEPELPRLPFWMKGCTNESALRMWGY